MLPVMLRRVGKQPWQADAVAAAEQVVAAELTTGGSKDVVMFVIRVADDTGEWTIARRFRHFESVHRSLRGWGELRGRSMTVSLSAMPSHECTAAACLHAAQTNPIQFCRSDQIRSISLKL